MSFSLCGTRQYPLESVPRELFSFETLADGGTKWFHRAEDQRRQYIYAKAQWAVEDIYTRCFSNNLPENSARIEIGLGHASLRMPRLCFS